MAKPEDRSQNHEEGDRTLFVISVAAELAGMHPQTLRQYDRLGLVTPHRTKGRGRRYSHSDVRRLRNIQRLSQEEGINLAGIQKIMSLTDDIAALRQEVEDLRKTIEKAAPHIHRVFTADSRGYIHARSPRDVGRVSAAVAGTEVERFSNSWHQRLPPEVRHLLIAALKSAIQRSEQNNS